MKVYHPQAPYQGIPAENVYCVADDMGVEVGVGYVIFFYQPDLFPNMPKPQTGPDLDDLIFAGEGWKTSDR